MSERLDKHETRILEKASLLAEGRAQLQRIRIIRQIELVSGQHLKRETMKAQVLKCSHEFSELLALDVTLPSPFCNQEKGHSKLDKIESELSRNFKEIDLLRQQLIVEEEGLLADKREGVRLDFITNQLGKTVSRATSKIQLAEELREIDEFTETVTNIARIIDRNDTPKNELIMAERCVTNQEIQANPWNFSTGIRSSLSNMLGADETFLRPSTHEIEAKTTEISTRNDLIYHSSGKDIGIGNTELDKDDPLSREYTNQSAQINWQVDWQMGGPVPQLTMPKALIAERSDLDRFHPLRGVERLESPSPSRDVNQMESIDLINNDTRLLKEDNSLTVTLPIEVSSEQLRPPDGEHYPRINWEKSLLTISVAEQDGMARVDLLGNAILRETLTNARKYFESELRQLFNAEVVIKESYHS